jgi:hypothetical protein
MATHSWEYTTGKFPLSEAFPKGHATKRPYVNASLRSEGFETHSFFAIADTGADYCMFSATLLPELGLEFDFLPVAESSGLGEDSNVRFAYVSLNVEDIGEWTIYAGFSKSKPCDDPALLGHFGFLERFRAVFDPSRGVFELTDL